MDEKVAYVYEYTGGLGTYCTTGKTFACHLPLVGDMWS